jgi:uncharacterized iron-regulated membrane protein
MRWQSILKTSHTWVGLIFGALLCLTCLSGSIVVFRPEIEAALSPATLSSRAVESGARADLDAAAARVLAANPEAKLTRVLLPEPSRNSFVLTIESGKKSSRRIIVDAETGKIAGELSVPWLDWMVDLHHNLLAGRTGRQVVGVIGVIVFLISASGLLLSVLRRPSWRALIAVRASGPRSRFYYELHRATGLWAYAFLTVLSFTGIALGLPDMFRTVLGRATPIAKVKDPTTQSLRPFSEYLRAAEIAAPGAQLTELRLPKSPKDPVSIRFRESSDFGTAGRNEIAMDAEGRILGVRRRADQANGVRIQESFTPIHYAEFGGAGVKILWSLAGIAPGILFVTGLLFWLRKPPLRRVTRDIEDNSSARADDLSLALRG